ncbi:MAG: PKD domain-containing protein [Flavobacteriales bacterium]
MKQKLLLTLFISILSFSTFSKDFVDKSSSDLNVSSLMYLAMTDFYSEREMMNCPPPPPPLNPWNLTLVNIIFPDDTTCSTIIPGYIRVCNTGRDTLTSFTVRYNIDAGPVSILPWTGSLPPLQCVSLALSNKTTTAGAHVYNVALDTIVNGTMIDSNKLDNALSSNFFVKSNQAVYVQINTDCSAQETSWVLRDGTGATITAGSGYPQQIQTIFEGICLDTGCFEFVIYDTWGDGLQKKPFCSVDGSYKVTDVATGITIAQSINPNFRDSAVHQFCLPFNAILTPGFTGCDTVYPTYPLYFVDTSISFPPASSWKWDFGDGTFSTLQNPVKGYSLPGTYNVEMVVDNVSLRDSVTKNGCVVVIPTPPGFCDTLDNFSSADSMIFYKLLGTWGYFPGNNGANISGFAEPFNLTGASNSVQRIILPVVEAHAGSPSSTFVINVYADNAGAPGAVLASDTVLVSSLVAGVNNEIQFTTPPHITGNFWAGFEIDNTNGDTLYITTANNRIISGINTTFVKTAGVWQSSSTVAAISTSTGIRVIYTDLPAKATVNVSRTRICQGQTTSFSATGLANYDSLTWYFPGGNPSTSKNTSQVVTYTSPGTYKAILYLEGICSNDSLISTILVDTSGSTASFTESSLAICQQDTVFFNGSITGNGTIDWTFPTGLPATSSQEDDTVFFNTAGVYNVKMKVVNGCGSDSVTKSLTVRAYPSTTISPDDTTICDGSSIALTVNGGSSYSWSNGSTTQSITVSPSVTTQYWAVGSNLNCSGDTAYVTITNNPIPKVVANATPLLVCLGDPIYFSMTGSNAITYEWDFGDFNTSTLPNQAYTYATPGTYTAYLKGKYGLCDSTSSITVQVNDCTGLGEEDLGKSIVVYPNPASRFLNISILEAVVEEVEMTIFNSSGQQVHNSVINPQATTKTINVNEFSEGVYLIRFNTSNKVYTKKLILVK